MDYKTLFCVEWEGGRTAVGSLGSLFGCRHDDSPYQTPGGGGGRIGGGARIQEHWRPLSQAGNRFVARWRISENHSSLRSAGRVRGVGGGDHNHKTIGGFTVGILNIADDPMSNR